MSHVLSTKIPQEAETTNGTVLQKEWIYQLFHMVLKRYQEDLYLISTLNTIAEEIQKQILKRKFTSMRQLYFALLTNLCLLKTLKDKFQVLRVKEKYRLQKTK